MRHGSCVLVYTQVDAGTSSRITLTTIGYLDEGSREHRRLGGGRGVKSNPVRNTGTGLDAGDGRGAQVVSNNNEAVPGVTVGGLLALGRGW